jgi:hypothetical protein
VATFVLLAVILVGVGARKTPAEERPAA